MASGAASIKIVHISVVAPMLKGRFLVSVGRHNSYYFSLPGWVGVVYVWLVYAVRVSNPLFVGEQFAASASQHRPRTRSSQHREGALASW